MSVRSGQPANRHLVAARMRRRWTQEQVAERVADHVQRSTGHRPALTADSISKLERGDHTWPQRDTRAAFRSVFEVKTDEELGFYSRRGIHGGDSGTHPLVPDVVGSSSVDTTNSSTGPYVSPHPGLPRYLQPTGGHTPYSALASQISQGFQSEEEIPTLRRDVLKLGAASMGAYLVELLALEPERMRVALDASTVSPERVDFLEGAANALGVLAIKADVVAVLDAAGTHFRSVRTLLNERQPSRYQTRLERTAAKLAVVVGEMLFMQGQFTLASQWYDTARHAAHAAGDTFLADIALASRAYLPTYSDDPQGVLEIVSPRLESRHPQTPATAWLWAFKAKAHASLGEQPQFVQCINDAHSDLIASPVDSIGPGIFSFRPQKLSFYEATGYAMLAKAPQAEDAVRRALSLYEPTDTTEPALVRLERASVLARVGEMEAACQAAVEALTHPNTYPAITITTRAAQFDQLLTRFDGPERDEWRELFTSVTRASNEVGVLA